MVDKMEAMWIVTKHHSQGFFAEQMKIFRTRDAARKYAGDKRKRSRDYEYYVQRATWGPEQ